MENEKIIKSIRGPKEVFEKLGQIAKDQGVDQGAALDALINCWNIQQAKGEIPGRAADIADFDAAIQQVQRAFLRSLELAQGAESRARASYAQQIEIYAGKLAEAEAENKRLKEMYANLNAEWHKVKDKLADAENRIVELSNQVRISTLLEKLTEASTKANAKTSTKAGTKTSTKAGTKAAKDETDEPDPDQPPVLKVISN